MAANNYIKVFGGGMAAAFFPFDDLNVTDSVKADIASRAHEALVRDQMLTYELKASVRRTIWRPCSKVGWLKIIGAF